MYRLWLQGAHVGADVTGWTHAGTESGALIAGLCRVAIETRGTWFWKFLVNWALLYANHVHVQQTRGIARLITARRNARAVKLVGAVGNTALKHSFKIESLWRGKSVVEGAAIEYIVTSGMGRTIVPNDAAIEYADTEIVQTTTGRQFCMGWRPRRRIGV